MATTDQDTKTPEAPTGAASKPQIEDAVKRVQANKAARESDEKMSRQERGVFIFTGEDGSHGIQLRGITVLEAYAAVSLVYNRLTKQFNGDA